MHEDGFIADKILLTQNADLNLVDDQQSTISIADVTTAEGDSSNHLIELPSALTNKVIKK